MINNLIFEAIVGSQAYGTSTPQSDVDKKGVYIQPIDELITWGYKQQIEVTKDETYYEIKRFLELAQSGNPTILELLFSPDNCILKTTPQFELIKEHRDKFVTKKCYNAFNGCAIAQIQKAKGLDKKINWEKDRIERKAPLDFCYYASRGKTHPLSKIFFESNLLDGCGCIKLDHMDGYYTLYTGLEGGICSENGNEIKTCQVPKDFTNIRIPVVDFYYNANAYSRHCKEYKEYQEWLKNRNTQRYVDIENHNQKIDGKNLLHCRRLLDMSLEIANGDGINVLRPNADYLLSIRQGKVCLEDIINKAEEDIKLMKEKFDNSKLPDEIDKKFLSDLLLKIRKM